MKRIRPILVLLIASACLQAAWAQSIHWNPPGGSLPVGQTSPLQLVFEGCSPKQDVPTVPKLPGITFAFGGQRMSNISFINGSITRNLTLGYAILVQTSQPVDIPSFSVETDKGDITVPAAHFESTSATVGGTGVALTEVASSELTAIPATVWAGEVFKLDYKFDADQTYHPSVGNSPLDWDPSPLITEDWPAPEQFQSTTSKGNRVGLAYRTRGMARTPGRFHLNSVTQLVNLSIGVTGFGFLQQQQYQQFSVTSHSPTLEVRPLPPAPSGFSGAVGEFKFTSKIVPDQVSVGEPVTWTLELSGKGNWPDIHHLPSREASKDFQVVEPKPKRTQSEGKLFDATLSEDVVLVPSKAGTYTLDPVELVYFDPDSGTYKTLTAPGATITVNPAIAVPQAPVEPANGSATATLAKERPKSPELPPAIPRDPLPQARQAPIPWAPAILLSLAAAFLGLLAILWLFLAYGRAKKTDPLNPVRAAWMRIRSTLPKIGSAKSAALRSLLLSWQQDSALLLGVSHAAPAPAAVPGPDWQSLWQEADRALYGTEGILPPDWVIRAEKALAAKQPASFQAVRLFLPRNLFPIALVLLFAGSLHGSDGLASYKAGDFESAERTWSRQLAQNPSDWATRYDLSLALAQQDRWGEAAAEASIAFVQHPVDPAIRWQLDLCCDKAGFVPAPVTDLLEQDLVHSLARLASPGDWQRATAAALLMLAASLALLVIRAYGGKHARWTLGIAVSASVVAIIVLIGSLVAFKAYGIASDTRAVITWRQGTLRSIPTEADVAQKTSPLQPGTAAICDKTFLDWVRLDFGNGQTGWVRTEEVIPFWTAKAVRQPE